MEKSKKKSSSTGGNEKVNDFKVGKSTFIQYKRGLIEKDYKIGEMVGTGAFATVRKVVNKSTGQVRALKIIKKQFIPINKYKCSLSMLFLVHFKKRQNKNFTF